jgi:hypothetical protein
VCHSSVQAGQAPLEKQLLPEENFPFPVGKLRRFELVSQGLQVVRPFEDARDLSAPLESSRPDGRGRLVTGAIGQDALGELGVGTMMRSPSSLRIRVERHPMSSTSPS